jgi:hypothetical protein
MNKDMVLLTVEEYKSLNRRANWLSCLESAGVDNWSGYSYAFDIRDEYYPEEEQPELASQAWSIVYSMPTCQLLLLVSGKTEEDALKSATDHLKDLDMYRNARYIKSSALPFWTKYSGAIVSQEWFED